MYEKLRVAFNHIRIIFFSRKSNAMITPPIDHVSNSNVEVVDYRTAVINRTAELLRPYEKYVEYPYYDQAGILTVGYGHVIRNSENFDEGISLESAENLLKFDVESRLNQIEDAINITLTINQYAAVMSLVFNIGVYSFLNSTLLRKLNSGDFNGAAEQFLVWNKVTINGVKQISRGLIARRSSEQNIFINA
jgi:lysozyme